MTTATLPASTGITSSSAYDNASQLVSVTHSKGSTTLAAVSYSYDADGNRLSKTTLAGTETYQSAP